MPAPLPNLPAELLTTQARAVVVPDASMTADARTLMCDQLKAVGFSEVTMLSKPAQPSMPSSPARGRRAMSSRCDGSAGRCSGPASLE